MSKEQKIKNFMSDKFQSGLSFMMDKFQESYQFSKDVYSSITEDDSDRLREDVYNSANEKYEESIKNKHYPKELEQEIKRDILTKEIDDEIKHRLDGTRNIIDSRPCFLKPAYFLQSNTPYIKANLIISGGRTGVKTIEFFPPTEEGKQNNIIKNFEYELPKSDIKLTITDADQDIIEYIAFVFENLLLTNPPILEIEYGWSNPYGRIRAVDQYIEDVSDEMLVDHNVYFHRKLFCYVNDFENNFSPEGVLELTFIGKREMNFPEPFEHFLPYDYLGAKPAVTIHMIHTLFTFIKIFQKSTNIDNKDEYLERLKAIAEFFFYYKQVKNIKGLLQVVFETMKFFDENKNISISDLAFQDLTSIIHQWTEEEKKGTNERANLHSLTKEMKNEFTSREGYVRILHTQLTATNKQELTLYDITENLRNLMKNGANVDQREGRSFSSKLRKYVMEITPILNQAPIHPWDVFKFVKVNFEEQFEELIKTNETISNKNSMLTIIQGFEEDHIGGFVAPEKREDKDKKEYYDYGNESYLIKASDININPAMSWGSLIKNIISKCYIWVNEPDWAVLNKGKEKPEEDWIDKEIKAKEDLKDKLPVPATGNCFAMSKEEALTNLNTFRMILEQRAKYHDEINIEDDETLKQVNNEIDKVNKRRNGSHVLLISLDIVPGMDQLFDPLNGKNQILQAYSYRAGGILAFTDFEGNSYEYYNPGIPTVWDINFPDVISFQPKFSFKQQIANVAQIMKQNVPNFDKQIDAIQEQIRSHESNIEEGKIAKDKVREEKERLKDELKALESQRDNFKRFHNKVPYQNPSMFVFEESLTQTSDYSDVQNKRKRMQNFRKHALLGSTNMEVDMQVIGDPIFDINSIGKYLFIKYMTQKGDLSYFTGVYTIFNITHTISNGEFKTSFSLHKDATAGSTEISNQLFEGVTENDNYYK